jgi:ABC-type glycerol-3-phosphate transport system substrate-binding protein
VGSARRLNAANEKKKRGGTEAMKTILAALALGASLLPWAASAQDKTALIAAAEKDGEVIMQSQPNQAFRDYVLREFPKAYPKITLSLSVLPSPQFVARLKTERAADKYLWDVAVAGASTGYELDKVGIVDPFLPELVDPEVNNPEIWGGWDEAFVDKDKKYVFAMSKYIAGPWYNALHLAPEKVEKLGLKALLEPEMKGKVVWHDPSVVGSGRSYGLLLRTRLGDEGLKKLVVDQRVVFVAQQNQVVENVARDIAWVGIGPPVRSLMAPYAQAGIKTDIRNMGTSPEVSLEGIGGSGIYVINKRPHPNATRLFVNWLLSKNVQHELAKALDQDSRRTDIASVAEPDSRPIRGAKYIGPQSEEMEGPLEDSRQYIEELRKQVK